MEGERMRDDDELARELLLRWAAAKLREPVEEQWWCGRCKALRGRADLEDSKRRADGQVNSDETRTCPVCGAPVEELPF